MVDSTMIIAIIIATVSAGLVTGVYFAFSSFIMRSFDQLGAIQAADTMNAINEVILRSWFMILFFGSTLLFTALSVMALLNAALPGRWMLFGAGLIYVLGMFACTVIFNVPLNNQLAQTGNDNDIKSETWALYFKQWTRWNSLRGGFSLVAVILNMYYLVVFT